MLNPRFLPGQSFDVPGINWENPEVINEVIIQLSRKGPVSILVDSEPDYLDTRPLFRPMVSS